MSFKRLMVFAMVGSCAIALVIWFRAGPHHYVNFPPTADGPWVAFGDSLTEGLGASAGHDYPTLLGEMLSIEIKNLGKSGETTEGGLARVEEVAQRHPRVVLLCLGGNDSLNGVPRPSMTSNLRTIIDRLQREGTFVVLIGVRSPSLRDHNETFFAALAKEKQVFYVPDILRGIAFKPIYMSDAIHPNDEGYRRIAERLEKLLKPLMGKLAVERAAR